MDTKTKRLVSQGTISVLIGCHSIIHSILVFIAWKKLYGRFPAIWETVCIFIHDIGHIGLDYLDSVEAKRKHWVLGARIAFMFFGIKGWNLIAGHCADSGHERSALYKADKYGRYLAPFWVEYLNTIAEPKLRRGFPRREAVERYRAAVRDSIESGAFVDTHQFYLDQIQQGKGG